MSMQVSHDVVVIGAGPAGSTAAAALAADGHRVVVLEEHAAAGTPVHCTGLLGWDAFREFALPQTLVCGEATRAQFSSRRGTPVHASSEQARAAVIDRAALDLTLAGRAADAGAEYRFGSRAEDVGVTASGVEVRVNGTELIRARVVILACGASYRLHRRVGLGLPGAHLHTCQVEIPFPAQSEIEVRVGRDVAPGGFGWIVPLTAQGESRARIGVMSEAGTPAQFAAFVQELAATRGIEAATVPAPRRKFLPLAPIPRTWAPRVLAVGDAAGLVKPTTGGGIYYGLLSGRLAAETLSSALRRDRVDDLRDYERRWQSRLGKDIRAGLRFRRAIAGMNDDTIDALLGLARVNGVLPLLQQHARFNWHRHAALALLRHAPVRQLLLTARHAG